MAGKDNLVPQNKRTKDEQRKIARQGGIKSGQARREKKIFKEAIEKQLGGNIDEIIQAIIIKGRQGDINAITFLRDTIGEKPTDKVENINTELNYEDYIKRVEDKDEY